MFREKVICDAIRRAYNGLFPNEKDRKKALAELDLELVAQSIRFRADTILSYQTTGSDELALKYRGPELFREKGCRIYTHTIQHHSTQVSASYVRELWLLEDGRFVEVSGVNTKYRTEYESFSTCYRTVHHTVKGKDWQDYSPEDIADAFEDFSRYPFDGEKGALYEV
ncbi:hypothetical protein QMP26_05845 [Enterocloster clostridioformis]|uniref:hypothetical protein n=1 Tax=Enterocloster clostridioformis TaxID=1531 RepID=UPI002676A74E|nr:hypothetical protein [Enterocloster clostridioformis]